MRAKQILPRPAPGLRPVRPAGWWFDLVLLAGLVGVTVALALAYGSLLRLDIEVFEWVSAHRPTPAYWIARVLNYLGQGGWLLTPLATGLALLLGWRTRSVRPLLVVAAAFALTYLTIGPVKLWTDRAAPGSKQLPPPESVLIFNDNLPTGEYDLSYPSGHVANAIVWYGVIALLLARLLPAYGRPPLPRAGLLAIRPLPPAIVFCTTTYLGHHWLTDAVAGLLLGLLLDRLLHRVPWDALPLPSLPYGLHRPAHLDEP